MQPTRTGIGVKRAQSPRLHSAFRLFIPALLGSPRRSGQEARAMRINPHLHRQTSAGNVEANMRARIPPRASIIRRRPAHTSRIAIQSHSTRLDVLRLATYVCARRNSRDARSLLDRSATAAEIRDSGAQPPESRFPVSCGGTAARATF